LLGFGGSVTVTGTTIAGNAGTGPNPSSTGGVLVSGPGPFSFRDTLIGDNTGEPP
jgi:hypothetical protein